MEGHSDNGPRQLEYQPAASEFLMDHASPYQTHQPSQNLGMRSPAPNYIGSFNNAHHFGIRDSNFYNISYHSENFMAEFARKTIPGAAFDSSERDPPPRCHPGTRLSIVERAKHFFANLEHDKALTWLVGTAGVGKSAIMQTLAEIPPTSDFTLGASLFFSVNGRDNGSKAVVTLAYQLAVKSRPYREFVRSELTDDPTLLEKAIVPQFNKFFVEPFTTHEIHPNSHKRFIILIDGLDECSDRRIQCTILDLISSFCTKYPTAPLRWIVASRPEPHISYFLSLPNIAHSYVKEDVKVDSKESCKEVELYLRKELENIRTKYPALALFPRWPAEHDFLRIAATAKGLFTYGTTVVKYVDDPVYANPISQLQEVLNVIEDTRYEVGEGKDHPMADLHALYARILSQVPKDTLHSTRNMFTLLLSHNPYFYLTDLPSFCNWLGMTPGVAYGCLHHLHSVVNIPSVGDAHGGLFRFHHKSFEDYLLDYKKSGMFLDLVGEAHQLWVQCAVRILNEASKAKQTGSDACANISVSWPKTGTFEDKRGLYRRMFFVIETYIKIVDSDHDTDLLNALRHINVRLTVECRLNSIMLPERIIFDKVLPKLRELDVVQKMPIYALKTDKIIGDMDFFISYLTKRPAEPPFRGWCTGSRCHQDFNSSYATGRDRKVWRKACQESKESSVCHSISYVLRDLELRKTHSPEIPLTTFIDTTGRYGWVLCEFIDPNDGLSMWQYIIPYQF